MLYCPQHNYGNPSINVDSALMSIAKRMYLKNVESGSMTILFRKYASPDVSIALITNFRKWQQ